MFLFSVLIQSVTASPSQHHVVDPGPDGDLGGVGVAIGAVAAADDAVIDDDSSVVVVSVGLVRLLPRLLHLSDLVPLVNTNW